MPPFAFALRLRLRLVTRVARAHISSLASFSPLLRLDLLRFTLLPFVAICARFTALRYAFTRHLPLLRVYGYRAPHSLLSFSVAFILSIVCPTHAFTRLYAFAYARLRCTLPAFYLHGCVWISLLVAFTFVYVARFSPVVAFGRRGDYSVSSVYGVTSCCLYAMFCLQPMHFTQ